MAEDMSPPITLPWDVLHQIACYIINSGDKRVNFMNVNKLWRSVIVDTPSFWTEISLCSSSSRSFMVFDALERIKWRIERAKDSQIRVIWDLKLFHLVDNMLLASLFLHRALPERWHSLTITSNIGIHSLEALSVLFSDHKFTSLRVLTFSWSSLSNIVEFIRIIERSASALSSITVSDVVGAQTRPNHPLALHLIGPQTEVIVLDERLVLHGVGATKLLPKIQKLTLSWEPDVAVQWNSLSTLTKLTLLLFHGHCLDKLHLPQLEELCIKSSLDRKPRMDFPKLRSLSLWDTALELLPCFDAHLLEELHLKGKATFPDSVLRNSDYHLSPNIITLDLEISPTAFYNLISLSPTIKYLQILIQSRRGLIERLCEVLLMENKSEEGGLEGWQLCGELRRLDISMKSAKLINDVTLLEEPLGNLFRERSKNCLETICIEWTDGSVFRLGLTDLPVFQN